jgi:hypothetical protein
MMSMMECHALPCSIDYTGTLPTAHVYFQPASISVAQEGVMDQPLRREKEGHHNDTATVNAAAAAMERGVPNNESSEAVPPPPPATTTSSSSTPPPNLQAASLRGRGLLSQVPSSSSSSLPLLSSLSSAPHGRLLRIDGSASSVSSSSSSSKATGGDEIKKTVHVEAAFAAVQEWHHEHDLSSLPQQQQHDKTTSTSRFQTALDWCHVAQALHAPLPILE